MSSYRKKPDRIDDPGPLLGKLRAYREELPKAALGVRPFGTVYHGLSMVVSAIDALAVLLNGQRDYFAASGSTEPEGERAAEADKRAADRRGDQLGDRAG